MRLFKKRKVAVIQTPGQIGGHIKPPVRSKGTYQVRRFTGQYECGCEVNQLVMIALVNEGNNPSEIMFCGEHGAPILYHVEPEREITGGVDG
jgi:hypothetical protein